MNLRYRGAKYILSGCSFRTKSEICMGFIKSFGFAERRTGCNIELSLLTRARQGGKAMKKIEAIIQPFRLEEVKEALKGIGVDGMTITDVRGHGRQKGHREVYRGQEYQVDLIPKVKLELVVAAHRAEDVIRTVMGTARTGKIGDGKIFVYEVGEAIRIRNSERGDTAL
jgi:nitrogen regulatory protein P-II 1